MIPVSPEIRMIRLFFFGRMNTAAIARIMHCEEWLVDNIIAHELDARWLLDRPDPLGLP